MALSKKDVDHIAHLARLHLSDAEKARFRKQLSDILAHVDALQSLDTTDVPAMSGAIFEGSRLREDIAGDAMPREDLLRNAPDRENNQFRVPPVLD
ncbi:MAG: Asp-tRNA(Asn)/Glu-tRNA(Gln) amidotransferase subunit GatC [Chloroflexi bacterium]|nr:Asp-tRNA(Asn)/Glu-tRNA(Gln) amidotransferase subunit GatC [Chloroflexota bacterium]